MTGRAPAAGSLHDSAGGVPRTFVPKLLSFPQVPAAEPGQAAAPVAGALDPFDEAARFPGRWQRYCLDHYRSHVDLAAAFAVSERTARKWREGTGGCNGDKVAIAIVRHPATAPAYLFAAE